MKEKNFLGVSTLLSALLLATGCGNQGHDQQSQAVPALQAPVFTASLRQLPIFTTAMGTLEPYEKAQLATRIMGQVRRVSVEEGDRVSAGEVMIQLDSRDISSRVEQSEAGLTAAKSQFNNARAYYERIKKLYGEQSATKQALDNALTAYEAAGAAVKAAEGRVTEAGASLHYTNITAPVSGFVTSRSVQKGDMASPGIPLATVEMQDSMKILTTVSEKDVGMISVGDTVWVETDVPGLERRKARVEAVVQGADPKTRRFRVRLVAANERGKLRSGMFARVYFKTGSVETLAVPDSAIVRRGQLTGLFVLDQESRCRLRWVRLGRTSDSSVEVLSGLTPGDRVVAGGLRLLREGRTVEEVR